MGSPTIPFIYLIFLHSTIYNNYLSKAIWLILGWTILNRIYNHFSIFIFIHWNKVISLIKVGLKLNIQKTKIIASGPITSWEIDGETVSYFIFLVSKITADGDCSHEIKRCLTPWTESYDQPRQHIQKQRHYFAD